MKRKARRVVGAAPTPTNMQVGRRREESPERSGSESSEAFSSSDEMSVDGSCVSSENEESREPPMVLVGCPRCLMYVMLSEANPKCPRCHSTVLLDFLNDQSSSEDDD